MYYFFLGAVQLPVTPSAVTIAVDGQNKSYVLINDGEINVLKRSKLSTVAFEFLIPANSYPFAVMGLNLPQQGYIEYLKKLKEDKKPFQFIIARFSPDGIVSHYTNLKASLESFTFKESADNGLDLVCEVKLKEYKEYGTKTLATLAKNVSGKTTTVATINSGRSTVGAPTPISATEYTVKPDDTMWRISQRTYGNGDLYKTIADTNGMANPTLIKSGDVITLPKK